MGLTLTKILLLFMDWEDLEPIAIRDSGGSRISTVQRDQPHQAAEMMML